MTIPPNIRRTPTPRPSAVSAVSAVSAAAPATTALTQNDRNPLRVWLSPPAVARPAVDPFPPSLAEPLAAALARRDGQAAADLLRHHPDSPYWEKWSARNPELHADLVKAAFTTPLLTLERKISAGEIETLEALRRCLEQVVSVCGRKFSRRSYRLLHPTDRHGRPRCVSGGADRPFDPPDRTPTPDVVASAGEIPALVREATADLDPLHVGIYWAVQCHRVHVGKAGAYQFVARLLHFDAEHRPLRFRRPEDIDLTVQVLRGPVNAVRRVYLRVRAVLAERLTAAGYDIPHDRKRRRR